MHEPEPRKTRTGYTLWIQGDSKAAKAERQSYYRTFWWFHACSACILLASSIAIIITAAVGDLHTKVYITISALRKNPTPPPGLFTDFETIGDVHIFWFGIFIPLFCGVLYHLPLAIYGLPIRLFRTATMTNKEYIQFEDDYKNGVVNNYGVLEWDENPYYLAWYERNLLYGASGIKHMLYGVSSSLYTVMVAELVGVTDFFLLSAAFLLTLFGFLNLWYLEYSHARNLHAIKEKVQEEERGSELIAGEETDKEPDEAEEDDVFIRLTVEMKDFIVESIENLGGNWVSLTLSLIGVFLPFILILTYFAVAVRADSSALNDVVYIAVSYYIYYITLTFILMWMYHMDIAFSSSYLWIELILSTFHILAYTVIVLTVVILPRDIPFFFDIEI